MDIDYSLIVVKRHQIDSSVC